MKTVPEYRITPEYINGLIEDIDYVHPLGTLTIALVTLTNGTIVTGESACVREEDFNAQIGRQIALEKAKQKIYPLEGYLLAQRLHESATTSEEIAA